ncbi:hypothetical protein L5515_018809 [Caenorhabditis briggsae]|uniref:Uncharacterized protein n=1 Tax=Caenorhabditis briggsae TaxID=6238 RepID=A0AAE9FGP5_CAEBR|nr:hypothetical protein L5515_018809 [Caenorhabditis briggsae]
MIYETDSPMDLASDVPFYRPPTDAASSFSPSGLRRTEIAVFDRNSNSNREKEHESDITQPMDELNNIFSRVYHGLRKQRKDGDEEFEKNLEAAELALKNLLTPSNNHGFVTRVDGNKASKTAREAMHSPALKARKPAKKSHNVSTTVSLIPKRNLINCSVCGDTDPRLPPDVHPLEYESQYTD